MTTSAPGGAAVPLLPAPLTEMERDRLRVELRARLPVLRALLDSAGDAVDGMDPEAALVYLGLLSARALAVLFPE